MWCSTPSVPATLYLPTRSATRRRSWVQAQSQRENLSGTGFGAEIHSAADRGELTAEEAPQVVRSLLTAGVDTTVAGLSAALDCLARHPGQFAQLRTNPALARNEFEEAIGIETPVQTFFRTTTRDVPIGPHTVPGGEKVLMFLGSANRDPRRWDRRDDYDITRSTVGHVGYGVGVHVCVSMLPARMESKCVLSALARKVSAIESIGPAVRRHNNTLRALSSLPVRLLPSRPQRETFDDHFAPDCWNHFGSCCFYRRLTPPGAGRAAHGHGTSTQLFPVPGGRYTGHRHS